MTVWENKRIKTICLDAGHADRWGDYGAVGADGTREADINLAVAKLIQQILQARGYRVLMTRQALTNDMLCYDDILGDLPARVNMINSNDVDMVVSIHCNSSANNTARGGEIYYKTTKGKELAYWIQNELKYQARIRKQSWFHVYWRGLKQYGAYYILSRIRQTIPAMLIELLFISNSQDRELLKTPNIQQEFAYSIANGIEVYFKRNL